MAIMSFLRNIFKFDDSSKNQLRIRLTNKMSATISIGYELTSNVYNSIILSILLYVCELSY